MTDGLAFYRFDGLGAPPVLHAISTRLGGHSQAPFAALNIGHTVGDDPEAVERNHALLYAALGLSAEWVVTARQVHGNRVVVATEAHAGQTMPETDALVTDAAGLYLMLRFADCVPVMLYDPQRRAVGLAHAGLQGTLARVTARTVEAMVTQLACRAGDLRAAIGPSIGPCCYQVGPEVTEAFREAFPDAPHLLSRGSADGRAYLDLWAANALQLARAGVRQIEVSRLCTACRTDLFFSHRAEQGRTGRFAALIGLRPDGV